VKTAIIAMTRGSAVIPMTRRRPLLLDSGVWIASEDIEDVRYPAARELVLDTGPATAALDLTLYEIANVIVRRWRNPFLAAGLCRYAVARCRDRMVRIDPDILEATAEIAVEFGLTSYDAAYVSVARRHGWTLVSTDVRDLVSKGLAITPDAAV
jgi:predicted nucleic acid-binding protein